MISHSQKADVYSWSMVTYELLTLQKPFAVGSIEQHKKAVCERGERPPMGHLRWLSPSVKELLENSWQADVQARWHMRDIKDSLDTIIKDVESSKGFRRDGSFGSFGYGNKHANGKAPSSSFTLCQGTEVDDMIVDFTNAVQTRYENVTGFLFCNGQRDTTTASVVADSEAAIAGKSMEKTAEGKKNDDEAPGREISLKSYMNVTEEKSIRFDIGENEGLEEKKEKEGVKSLQKDAKKDEKSKKQGRGELKEEEGFITTAQKSLSKAVWGGFARPHMSRAMRPPTTATASESEFSERSLSMHSVRLQAAQNRRPTAWVAPRRIISATQSHNHGHRSSFDEYGRARPYASRSLRAHSTKLDATIELENEDEEDAGKDLVENSLILPSIKLNGNDQAHLEEIAEEAGDLVSKGSSLRSTSTPANDTDRGSSLRSTSTPVVPPAIGMDIQHCDVSSKGSSLRSTSTPVPHAGDSAVINSSQGGGTHPQRSINEVPLAAEPQYVSPDAPPETSPMTLDPNTAAVGSPGSRDRANGGNYSNDEEAGFGSIALSSTRIKATKVLKEEEEDTGNPPGNKADPNGKGFIVATASV